MNLEWLDAFLISGLFSVVMVVGLGLLLHLQLGLARIVTDAGIQAQFRFLFPGPVDRQIP